MTPLRAIAYIDGFNIYHSIDELNIDPATNKNTNDKHHLKWCNYWSLINSFVHPKNEVLVGVKYFSAYATWDPNAYKRHRDFVEALRSVRVEMILGEFKEKDRSCKHCRSTWKTHEEKCSDVNLALHLLNDAKNDKYDMAIILTADLDITPAVAMIKSEYPEKQMMALLPKRRSRTAHVMRGLCHRVATFREFHLEKNLFPDKLTDAEGKTLVVRPSKYAPSTPPPSASAAPPVAGAPTP